MNDKLAAPEPISGVQYYQLIRAQIEHEDNLINQRLSWFVAAQAFLFSAYAINLNGPAAPRGHGLDAQQEILFILIPAVAICLSLVSYLAVIAAMLAMARLRRRLEAQLSGAELALLPPVQGYRPSLLLGQASPLFLPFLFLLSWIVLLLRGLF